MTLTLASGSNLYPPGVAFHHVCCCCSTQRARLWVPQTKPRRMLLCAFHGSSLTS